MNSQLRSRLIRKIIFIELFAAHNGQTCFKFLTARGREQRFNGPILAVVKGLDLLLALNNDAQANGLDTTCRARAGQFTPQNRRKIKAHKIVQRAACQISFHKRLIDLTRIFHRFGYSCFGDRIENDAANGRVFLDGFALGQGFLQMPADRFALAIRVGRENEFVVVFQRVRDGFDMFFAIIANFPLHLEIGICVDRSILWRQVTNMAVRGENGVVGSQILVDCLGFSRGFDNNNWHDISLRRFSRISLLMGPLHVWGKPIMSIATIKTVPSVRINWNKTTP